MKAYKYTAKRRKAFLTAYSESRNIGNACIAAGICRQTYTNWRDTFKEFNTLCTEAEEMAVDKLEERAFRIANDDDPGMIKWMLARLRSKQYGAALTLHHDNRLSDEDLNKIIMGCLPKDIANDTDADAVETEIKGPDSGSDESISPDPEPKS